MIIWGIYDFYQDGKGKTTVSWQLLQMRLVNQYQTSHRHKGERWKMSSVTPSVILLWLSSVVALIQLSAIMLVAGWTHSAARGRVHSLMEWLGSQGIGTDITLTLCHDTEWQRGKQQQCKMYRFGQVKLSERQTLGIKWHSLEKSIYCDVRRWYFKSHLSLLTFTNWLFYAFNLSQFAHLCREDGIQFCFFCYGL